MCGNYGDDIHNLFDEEVTKTFNRFAGKTVDPSNPRDPVLKEMQEEATSHFSRIRLVPEGAVREENERFHLTRINAELVADGGKWKIGARFFRG